MHPYAQDITGNKYGRWTVLSYSHSKGNGRTYYDCQCDCGTLKTVARLSLVNGKSQSCGCLHLERVTKHKERDKKLYSIWHNFIDRCYRTKNPFYQYYGGRGITVCDEWRQDYSTFHKWAFEHGYKHGLSIDRIDNNLGYTPDNCKFSTNLEQMQNRRSTLKITYNNETKTMFEWANIVGISYYAIRERIKRGWCAEQALTIPSNRTNRINRINLRQVRVRPIS